MTRLRGYLSAIAFIAFFATSCSESRSSQCSRLIAVANRAVGEMQAIIQTNTTPNYSAYLKVAETVDNAKAAMEAIELNDPQLQEFQSRFISLYSELGKSSRALSEAIQKEDIQAAESAQQAFEAATNKEPPLVNEVNLYCNPG
ncbi:MAG TPA: hypothetical protein IGS37_10505 [Synechococcales cyanobacterium M55_K2018_004]|nr:hypothetical protein [Synechococcales cyanobacterium M55_K2018_004]